MPIPKHCIAGEKELVRSRSWRVGREEDMGLTPKEPSVDFVFICDYKTHTM